jgi:hypothetical protein
MLRAIGKLSKLVRSHQSPIERAGKGRSCGTMISVETYVKDYEASYRKISENGSE